MPKYFCEYCGIYLTHSSPGGRNQHSKGRKHINNKIEYYSQILYEFQQGIGASLIQMTSHILKSPKDSISNPYNESIINDNNKIHIDPNITIPSSLENPLKKGVVHIPGQRPLTIPLTYVPNIPIKEKIMKAIPPKIQPQFKKIAQIQEDMNKREINNTEEENDNNKNKNSNNKNKSHPKNFLENLKKMKYCYNDPNPENNGHIITDLLKNEDDEEPTYKINK